VRSRFQRRCVTRGEEIRIGGLCRERRIGFDDEIATYIVAILCPFDAISRACSEFGGELFEGYGCEAEGPEERG
jgi:hypothetical protein